MSISSLEVQKAVYVALIANSTLAGLLANGVDSIIDGAPVDEDLPYVSLGEIEGRDFSTKSFVGSDDLITIHIWSDHKGKKELGDIAEQVKLSINRQALTVVGNQLIDIMFDTFRPMRDQDATTRHGIIEFKALTIED